MDPLWLLWVMTAGAGGALGLLRPPARPQWAFDALALFLLANLVCDSAAWFSGGEGWRLNAYALSAGFALTAWLRVRRGPADPASSTPPS